MPGVFLPKMSEMMRAKEKTPARCMGDNHDSSGSSRSSATFLNIFFYLMCISALGLSLYANYRQTHVEERIRHLRHLDDRLTALEAQLLGGGNTGASVGASSASWGPTGASSAPVDYTNVVRKLSMQAEGIQRLRRDVSQLHAIRRQQRQTSIQSSQECTCPPGEYPLLSLLINEISFFVVFSVLFTPLKFTFRMYGRMFMLRTLLSS